MLDAFSPVAVAEIRSRLQSVRDEGIRIGFAIESGSRAWGFPSPDSDYDCRFVYVRPISHHIRLSPTRDVIEFPIIGDIDTGGWDLRKALHLALKGNAVIVEWVKSPLVYEEEPGFRHRLSALLADVMEPRRVARHYAGLLREHYPKGEPATVKLKKFLYAIRPAIALHWMEQRGYRELPPMNMLECMADMTLAPEVRAEILALIEKKMMTREMGDGTPPAILRNFVSATNLQYADLSGELGKTPIARDEWRMQQAEAFYMAEVSG